MPSYEIALILRTMSKPELASALRRAALYITGRGGMVRRIENLGTRELPYRISAHGTMHRQGSYYLLHFESPPHVIEPLKDDAKRDVDVVRRHISRPQTNLYEPPECTLEDEMQPPAHRPSVLKLIEEGRKPEKRYNHNTGLDYYPFQM